MVSTREVSRQSINFILQKAEGKYSTLVMFKAIVVCIGGSTTIAEFPGIYSN